MKILMESTPHLATVDGIECRVWNGITENETQCFVFVHRVAVRNSDDKRDFLDLCETDSAEVMIVGQ
jgi:hypothetical protein